jgi:type VI secretion system protein ImpB
MTRKATIAPRERVNITYKPATGEASESVELPLKLLVLSDLRGHADPTPVEERRPISIDKDNFGRVMAEQDLCVRTRVPDRLQDDPQAELDVTLRFAALADFTPEGIAGQVPALQHLQRLRSALITLKGPMGNVPTFRRTLQQLLADDDARTELLRELGAGEPA